MDTFLLIVMFYFAIIFSRANKVSVVYVLSTYEQASCSGVRPQVLVQVALHFTSSTRYLTRGRFPCLKLKMSSRMVISLILLLIVTVDLEIFILKTFRRNDPLPR